MHYALAPTHSQALSPCFCLRLGIRLFESMQEKNVHAVELGKLGGAKGGKSRAERLTPEERSASARKAALARWSKAKGAKRKKNA